MPFLAAATICLIACHGGPADHFATFAENLSCEAKTVEIYASGPALKKFQERGIEVDTPFSIDYLSPEEEDALAEQIAKACSTASVVITDVGHAFDIKIQKALSRQAVNAFRFAYYDNPEPYVPGGYSAIASQVMQIAQGILFANSNLAHSQIFQAQGKEIDFGNKKKIGIGYYPINQAEKIACLRSTEQASQRQAFFEKNGLKDQGQKVLIYFGGNNEEYFSKALPAFLSLLEEGMRQADLADLVIIIQQHPGAKAKNIDRSAVELWITKHQESPQVPKIFISNLSSDDVQILADAVLYYQTSMGPQFVLAGIPTIQIGHETFEDILVKNRLSPSVTKVDQLIAVIDSLNHPQKTVQKELIFESLGIRRNWLQVLEITIKEASKNFI